MSPVKNRLNLLWSTQRRLQVLSRWQKLVSACMLSHFSCVRLLQPYGWQPARLLYPWDSPGKNTGAGCHALLQGIFLTQGSDPHFSCFLHWQVGSLPLLPPGTSGRKPGEPSETKQLKHIILNGCIISHYMNIFQLIYQIFIFK